MSEEVFEVTIRVAKEHSAFTYFTLESHEGLCFYSTLDGKKEEGYRDIHITCTLPYKSELLKVLDAIKTGVSLEFINSL